MRYRYLIVGAGSAGATLAARLATGDDAPVLLLEAGPDWRSAEAPDALRSPNPSTIITAKQFSRFRWDALTARRTRAQTPRLYWRGRGLGGSSSINGQIAIRGMPEDFDAWAEEGCTGWSFAEVLAYFNRLETDLRYGSASYHGSDGPIPIFRANLSEWGPIDRALAESALDSGQPWAGDHNAPGALGVSPYAINSRDQRRVTTNDAYLEPNRGRNNLTIQGDALVDQVLFNGDRAVGVSILRDGQITELHADRVILAAGAVHSPAILMRSGIGPESHLAGLDIPLRRALPVGQGFQDHPSLSFVTTLKPEHKVPPGFRHTNCCVRYSAELGAGPGDMMMIAMNRLGDALGRMDIADRHQFGMVGVWVNECRSRGWLELQSRDPRIDPVIEENMLDDPSDLTRMRDGIKRLIELVGHDAFAGVAESVLLGASGTPVASLRDDRAIDDWAMANAADAQHATSTCRMGSTDDPRSVVDPDCQVLGVEGLSVIDASVMPSVPRANTHLSTVMIAERMADRLLAKG